jgi:hypothetical protein
MSQDYQEEPATEISYQRLADDLLTDVDHQVTGVPSRTVDGPSTELDDHKRTVIALPVASRSLQRNIETNILVSPVRPSAPAKHATALLTMVRNRLLGHGDPKIKVGGQTVGMQALLGGSLFATGALGTRAVKTAGSGSAKLRKSRRGLPYGWLASIVALTFGVLEGVDFLKHRAGEAEAAQRTEVLKELLRCGSFAQAADVLSKIPEDVRPKRAALIARAEATIYRYHDADPKRRERVLRYFETASDKTSPEWMVTIALLAPRLELLAQLDGLRRAAEADREDPEPIFLAAEAWARAGVIKLADAAFAQAEGVAPAHLPHLARYVAYQVELGRAYQVSNLISQMRDVTGNAGDSSGYTMLALSIASTLVPELKPTESDDPGTMADMPPVYRAYVHEHRAMQLLRSGDSDRGIAEVRRSVDAVREEPAFMVDLADALLTTSFVEAAKVVAQSDGWPSSSAAARDVEARLAIVGGDLERGASLLRIASKGGLCDPRAALEYARSPRSSRDEAKALLRNAAEGWPHNEAVRAEIDRTEVAANALKESKHEEPARGRATAKRSRRRRG